MVFIGILSEKTAAQTPPRFAVGFLKGRSQLSTRYMTFNFQEVTYTGRLSLLTDASSARVSSESSSFNQKKYFSLVLP